MHTFPAKGIDPGGAAIAEKAWYQRAGLWAGPILALIILLSPAPEGLSSAGWRTAAAGILMAVWWATEALPVPVTALLPIALFPLLQIADVKAATAPYANSTIYLFLGGFLVALAVQRCGLHKRIALTVIVLFGGSGASMVGGFMVASALVSMWVTNTSTTMMLLPIAVSVAAVVGQTLGDSEEIQSRFPKALLLGVAYAATIGGIATLVGTPPNALLAGFMQENYGVEIGFAQWMLVGVPLTAVLLPVCWWLLTKRLFQVTFTTNRETREHLRRTRDDLGRMSAAERRVTIVFLWLALCWMGRPLLMKTPGLGGLSDTGIAMMAGVILFLVPTAGWRSARLLEWKDTKELPWGVLILFGGGLSLAAAVSSSGLAAWLGEQLTSLKLSSLVLLVVLITTLIIYLTELTSNLATTATFLPVVAAVATQSGYDPIILCAPVAIAASCAFMLPVATPPNAVVYSSGLISIPDMIRAGFWLNIISIGLASLVAVVLVSRVLG
ncbi:MAG: DASS family sodium-coupled anion symporter [Acidobacteria bacterium]|uniref:DASS family sodium-coupled anion symporter n=1 Tax=Candidatus Polarisedimenticola svalbardensis TaxID=2886004 RepID=A0A8J6Y795_9BACT|nr:DASS family sodium-coupled anion symporter [Candidatus Polarisedimenticola svalbardensis]